ncbi:MAG TPA: hypothetical protein VIM77_14305, partial [Mucilaginibacter sp.]
MLDIDVKDLLLKIANEDDLASFKKIYFLYYERLLKLACSFVKLTEAGEEIVDDVFVKIWATRTQLATVNNLTVYLYVAVKNRSINYNAVHRMTYIDIESVNFEFKDHGSSPEDILITDELLKVIHITVERLPAECRMVYKLVKEDRLKYR